MEKFLEGQKAAIKILQSRDLPINQWIKIFECFHNNEKEAKLKYR